MVANVALWYDARFWDPRRLRKPAGNFNHPIRKLMIDARNHHDEVLTRRSFDVKSAAAKYRERRGRHPPPGFESWFAAAHETKAIVVEEFFDRIYKDLTPYWALESETLKKRSKTSEFVVRVRGGKATAEGEVGDMVPWLKLWTELVGEFAQHLPDVDMPINYMDESRIIVPFEEVAKLVSQEAKQRKMPDIAKVTTKFQGLGKVDNGTFQRYDPVWRGIADENYWNLAVQSCPPDSPAHGVQQVQDLSGPAEFPQNYRPNYAYKGFIQNWTAAVDPCTQPHIRQLHGTFIEPISQSVTQELIPLFGGSKLPVNNEILIPGAMYLTKREFYSGGENSHGPSWERKKDGLIWRGEGSGGRAKPHDWHHFHRHRLIDMLNATSVTRAETEGYRAKTFELPSHGIYPSRRIQSKNLGSWLKTFADAKFVHLCPPGECQFFDDFFKTTKELPMKKQYYYKFLPDVDGNSFSARFRGFLRSTSLPLKATIYTEWHDDRLVPWQHFVPIDNTFQDLYAVLEYFADQHGPGDAAARVIAERGKDWAEKVLRREDMRLYVWRLLLEWARICDANREFLGFVDDLK